MVMDVTGLISYGLKVCVMDSKKVEFDMHIRIRKSKGNRKQVTWKVTLI